MKQFAIIAILLLATASIALPQAMPGGIAREVALGGSNAGVFNPMQPGGGLVLNPFIIDDPSLLLLNPAYQAKYKDYLWTNIAGGGVTGANSSENGYGNQNAGVAFSVTDKLTLGVILSYDPTAANLVDTLPTMYFYDLHEYSYRIPKIQNMWEVVGALDLPSMTLGFGVMYGWSSYNYKENYKTTLLKYEEDASSYLLGFRGGMIMNVNDNFTLDASASLRFDEASMKYTRNPSSSWYGWKYTASGTELQFDVRAKMKMSEKFNFVPYGMFSYLSAKPKEDTPPNGYAKAPYTWELSSTNYAFGVGGEYKTKSFYFAGGLSWQHVGGKMEYKDTAYTATDEYWYNGLPVFNLGGEWWLTDWMAGRIGYYRMIGSGHMKYDNPSYTDEYSISYPHSFIYVGGLTPSTNDGLVTLGLGFKFGGFALDGTVSEEALRRGLGIIGAQDNINTFGYLTASYSFGE